MAVDDDQRAVLAVTFFAIYGQLSVQRNGAAIEQVRLIAR